MDPLTACREILRRSGSNFAPAFAVLPREQRDAMTAFYAFCRVVDDAVDCSENPASACRVIRNWRGRIDAIGGGGDGDPVCLALGGVIRRYGVRREHLNLILDGVEQDLHVRRYGTFAELYEYCYRVASAVGLVCVTILGENGGGIEVYAELTGIAVQLTNILRDVAEDARRDRIYLPSEDLRRFGVREADLLGGRTVPGMKDLLRFQAARARQFFEMSDAALPPSARGRLFFAEALKEIYRRLLDRLCEEDLPVFGTRVSVGKGEKVAIVLKHRFSPSTLLEAFR
jgi:phytoene synthase